MFYANDSTVAPVCRPGQTKVYGVAKGETINITCELEANPREVSFSWRFNSSMEAMEIDSDVITSSGSQSKVTYTPTVDMDYGTLLCSGTNEQGTQVEPCVFLVVPAGRICENIKELNIDHFFCIYPRHLKMPAGNIFRAHPGESRIRHESSKNSFFQLIY